MSQISPPIRILLIAVIGVVAVYMLFLRPKPEEATPVATAPAAATPVPAKDPNATTQSKPGSAVNQAVRGADNASARADAAAGGAVAETEGGAPAGTVTANPPAAGNATTSTPLTGAGTSGAAPAPITKETLRSLPKDVRGAVRKHKVLVLLFYNNRSADDRAVRRALKSVNRYGGQVFVDAHGIRSVSRYQAITRGVDVEQSPTVIVADRNLKAEKLVGYVDDKTIDQAVVDAIVASGGSLLKDPYYRKIDRLCAGAQTQINALPKPASAAALPVFLMGAQQIAVSFKRDAAAIKPAKRYRRFHKNFVGYTADTVALVAAAQLQLKAKPAAGLRAIKRLDAEGKRLDKRFIAKNGAHGLRASCF